MPTPTSERSGDLRRDYMRFQMQYRIPSVRVVLRRERKRRFVWLALCAVRFAA
jgi:hypothetical protein